MEDTKIIASDELLMEQFHNQDWQKLWIKLFARCQWVLRKRYTVKWSNEEIKEFSRNAISEVIEKIFIKKERNWNIERYPNFEEFIVGVIDSHINNTLNKKAKESSIGDNEFLFNKNNRSEPNAQEVVMTEELRKQIFKELEILGADEDELLLFECLADGFEKVDDIKKELGLSDTDFHNIWRRFKRRRIAIQEKLAGYGN